MCIVYYICSIYPIMLTSSISIIQHSVDHAKTHRRPRKTTSLQTQVTHGPPLLHANDFLSNALPYPTSPSLNILSSLAFLPNFHPLDGKTDFIARLVPVSSSVPHKNLKATHRRSPYPFPSHIPQSNQSSSTHSTHEYSKHDYPKDPADLYLRHQHNHDHSHSHNLNHHQQIDLHHTDTTTHSTNPRSKCNNLNNYNNHAATHTDSLPGVENIQLSTKNRLSKGSDHSHRQRNLHSNGDTIHHSSTSSSLQIKSYNSNDHNYQESTTNYSQTNMSIVNTNNLDANNNTSHSQGDDQLNTNTSTSPSSHEISQTSHAINSPTTAKSPLRNYKAEQLKSDSDNLDSPSFHPATSSEWSYERANLDSSNKISSNLDTDQFNSFTHNLLPYETSRDINDTTFDIEQLARQDPPQCDSPPSQNIQHVALAEKYRKRGKLIEKYLGLAIQQQQQQQQQQHQQRYFSPAQNINSSNMNNTSPSTDNMTIPVSSRTSMLKAARDWYKASIELDPYNGKSWLNLAKVEGKIYFGYARSCQVIDHALTILPQNPNLYQLRGLMTSKFAMGKIQKYLDAIYTQTKKSKYHKNSTTVSDSQTPDLFQHSSSSHSSRINIKRFQKKYLRESRSYFIRALEIDPLHTPTLMSWARVETFAGNFFDARNLFERAHVIEHKRWLALQKALALYADDHFRTCIIKQKITDARESWVKVLHARAIFERKAGHIEFATDILLYAQILEPKNTFVLQALAENSILVGNLELAKSCLLKAVLVDAQNSSAFDALGRLYVKLKQYDLGRQCLEKSIRISMYDSRPYYSLSCLEFSQGNIERSLRLAEYAASLNKSDINLRNHLKFLRNQAK